jgi:hypothetical protein
MRAVAPLLAALAAAVAVGGALGTPAKPNLRITGQHPLGVAGTAFESRELVKLQAFGSFGTRTLRIRTTADGTFAVHFRKVSGDPCVLRRLLAVGARGSRAGLRVPPGACAEYGPPPLG